MLSIPEQLQLYRQWLKDTKDAANDNDQQPALDKNAADDVASLRAVRTPGFTLS